MTAVWAVLTHRTPRGWRAWLFCYETRFWWVPICTVSGKTREEARERAFAVAADEDLALHQGRWP